MKNTFRRPACTAAFYRDGRVHVAYADGVKIDFPLSANGRLRGEPEEKLSRIEIGHFGLSWPELDEDLSHEGLRAGRYGRV